MAKNQTNIATLVTSAADAQKNMFSAQFTWPWDGSKSDAQLAWRIKGFEIPSPKADSEQVPYLGVTYRKVKAGVILDRVWKIECRLDATYEIYSLFEAWKKVVADVNNGGTANTTPFLGTIVISAIQGPFTSVDFAGATSNNQSGLLSDNDNLKGRLIQWTLKDVAVLDVGTPKFENTPDGGALTYTVSGTFGRVLYPFDDQNPDGNSAQ